MVNAVYTVSSILNGGAEIGIYNLIKGQFFDNTNFHIVELREGYGEIREEVIKLIGKDRVISLRPREEKRLTLLSAIGLGHKLMGTFRALHADVAVLSHSNAKVMGRLAAIPYPHMKVISFEHDVMPVKNFMRSALYLTSWRNDVMFGDSPGVVAARKPDYPFSASSHFVPLITVDPGPPRIIVKPEEFNIVSMGRLAEEKNYDAFIYAASELIVEGYNVNLTIAGEGRERPKLQKIIADLDSQNPGHGIARRISLPGFMFYDDKQRLLDNADLYVQCSFSEGLNLALIEAMAAGIPCASTLGNGVRYYGNDKNIRLIENTSHVAIADTVRDMIENYASIASNMSRDAVRSVSQILNTTQVQQQWRPAKEEMHLPRRVHAMARDFSAEAAPLVLAHH